MKYSRISAIASVSLAVVALAGWSSSVSAQDTAAAEEESEDVIIVTGTAIRGVAPVGSATVSMDRTSILESGVRDVSQIIANLPQGSSLGTSQNSSGGRQQGVNLRGLGNNATLVLFDNHRWVNQGVAEQIPDPSVIPFAALARVEVVTDGASAIYGSDAVAGVVNYILRDDYQGAEVTGRYVNTLYNQYQIDGVAGNRWDNGGILLGFSYTDRGRVRRNERPYLMQDLRPYGGNDLRLVGTTVSPGTAGAVIIGTTVYGLPNTNGVRPTAAQAVVLNPALATSNPAAYESYLFDTGNFYDYFASRQQFSALVKANQEIAEGIEAEFTFNFNRRQGTARATEALQSIGIRLTPSSPYYIQGLPNPTANQTLVYNLGLNFASDRELTQKNKEDTLNTTFEIGAELFGDYALDTYISYGQSTGCNVCQAQANSTIASGIANPGQGGYNSAFNPYQSGPQAGAEMLIAAFLQEGNFRTLDIGTKLSGTLFELPAGAARVAIGAEFTRTWFNLQAQNKLNIANTFQYSRDTDSGRTVKSLFAELYVPLLSDTPLFQRLDLSAAVRYDDYSDYIRANLVTGRPVTNSNVDSINPKFGLTWEPISDLTLRASWGTSFRMPTLIENNPGTLGQTNRVFIPNGVPGEIPITNTSTGQSLVLNRIGNTAGLQPESATVWSAGFDFEPSFIPDLRLGVTYYNVDYKDRIENLPNQNATTAQVISSATNRALFADYFIVAPQPTTCVNGNLSTYNPAYLPFLNDTNTVFSPFTTNDCQLTGIVNGGRQNLGRVKQEGLDFTLAYRHDIGIGELSFNSSFSKILNLQKSLTRSGALFDALDTFGFQISERGRSSLGLNSGGFSGQVAANYVGSYLNNATITVGGVKKPDTQIPSWTTFDANISYEFDEDTSGAFGGLRLGIGVQNLTDKQPPIVLSGNNAIDTNNHNIWGRIWTFEVTKRF